MQQKYKISHTCQDSGEITRSSYLINSSSSLQYSSYPFFATVAKLCPLDSPHSLACQDSEALQISATFRILNKYTTVSETAQRRTTRLTDYTINILQVHQSTLFQKTLLAQLLLPPHPRTRIHPYHLGGSSPVLALAWPRNQGPQENIKVCYSQSNLGYRDLQIPILSAALYSSNSLSSFFTNVYNPYSFFIINTGLIKIYNSQR